LVLRWIEARHPGAWELRLAKNTAESGLPKNPLSKRLASIKSLVHDHIMVFGLPPLAHADVPYRSAHD
jgi:hypothetical protein